MSGSVSANLRGAIALCPAGRDHESLHSSDEAWSALAYVGRCHMPADETGPAETLELRNCSCHSTIARVLPSTAESV